MICACKSVKNDVYGWDKGSNTTFNNTKNGAGNCSCVIFSNKTGKESRRRKVNDVILTEDKRR